MSKILAIGRIGALLANTMKEYGEYDVFTFSQDEDANVTLPDLSNPEEYEEFDCDLKPYVRWLDKKKGSKLYCTICGGDLETAMSLRLLQLAAHKNIEVLYVRPDTDSLSGYGKLHERTLYSVLQEYARSALFSRTWLFSYLAIERTLGSDLSILEYDKTIIDVVARAICSIDLYRSGKKVPIKSTISQPYDIDRIATISIVNVKESIWVDLHPLRLIKERELHYAFPTQDIQQNGKTILEIARNQDKAATPEEGVPWALETSYAIYETEHETPFAYAVLLSSEIQNEDEV